MAKPESPFHVDLHTVTKFDGSDTGSADKWIGTVGNPIAIDATFRHNALSNVQIRLAAADPVNDVMMERGVWARVFYRGKLEMSGKIRTRQGSFMPNGDRIYQVRDDRAAFDDLLAWVNPNHLDGGRVATDSHPITAGQWQGTPALGGRVDDVSGYWDWTAAPDGVDNPSMAADPAYTGLAADVETAIRKLWLTKTGQLGMFWIHARGDDLAGSNGGSIPNTHLGGSITSLAQLPTVRFNKLSEIIDPLTAASGLRVRLLRGGPVPGQNGWAGLPSSAPDWHLVGTRLEITEPQTWDAALTANAGIIVAPSTWTLSEASATRILVGGPGELSARMIYQRTGYTSDPDRGDISDDELADGWISEVFRDATSAQLKWPDGTDDLFKVAAYYMNTAGVSPADKATFFRFIQAAADTGLLAGAATTGMSLTLAETQGFHYGGTDGIQLGDYVTVQREGLMFTDQLSEVVISWSRSGIKVTPKVGEVKDDPNRQIYQAISRLGAAQRRLSASK